MGSGDLWGGLMALLVVAAPLCLAGLLLTWADRSQRPGPKPRRHI